jgi:HK97 gp10 family phage protein
MADVQIKGLQELYAALQALPVKLEQNVMRGALRAGAKILEDAAKQGVPVAPPSQENQRLYGGREGLLRDSVRVSVRVRKGRITASVKAGGKSKGGGVAYYARFVEFGTAAHYIKAKNGKGLSLRGTVFGGVMHPGARKKPFMRPAFDTRHVAAAEAAREYIRSRLATKHGIDVPGPGSELDEDTP